MLDITTMQFAVLFAAGGAFALAFGLALRTMRTQPAELAGGDAGTRLGTGARVGFTVGVLLALALVVWRLVREDQRGQASGPPLFNYFDLFLLLGLLLAGLSIYFRITRHLRSLTFFLLPMIALVLVLGGVLSLLYSQTFDYASLANIIHVASVMVGSACFALGCAGGVVYLLADRQLKKKGLTAEHRWLRLPSLASAERFNQYAVLIGFPLLTVAMISGAVRLHEQHRTGGSLWGSPKVFLAVASWLVYGVLIYIPLAPSFRGRRAAWLSIGGFILLLSVFFAVRGM